MDILEAYRRTLGAAEELRAVGIEVEINPSKSEKAQGEDPLPRDKWVIVTFRPKNEEQVDAINRKADELGWAGIVFDTSGHPGERDWEIDWSFDVRDTPDGEGPAGREEVEDLIDEMGEKDCGPHDSPQR